MLPSVMVEGSCMMHGNDGVYGQVDMHENPKRPG